MGYFTTTRVRLRRARRHRLHRARRSASWATGWSRCARSDTPFGSAPKLPREAVFVEPEVVAEIEFREWTSEGVHAGAVVQGLARRQGGARGGAGERRRRTLGRRHDSRPDRAAGVDRLSEALFDEVERLPEGALSVVVDGRTLKITNWDKVLYPEAGFTKGDLIAYYARVAPAVLPHLRDRPLTLKRYPNGVDAKYFYEKQSPVAPARVGADRADRRRSTTRWLRTGRRWSGSATWPTSSCTRRCRSRAHRAADDARLRPRSRRAGRDRRVLRVGLVLRGLFDQLGLSASPRRRAPRALQVYVPLNTDDVDYAADQAVRASGSPSCSRSRMPELVVSRMTKRLRTGKVLVDWSQNDDHKTTVPCTRCARASVPRCRRR